MNGLHTANVAAAVRRRFHRLISRFHGQQNPRFRPPGADSLHEKFYWRTVTPISFTSFTVHLARAVGHDRCEHASTGLSARRRGSGDGNIGRMRRWRRALLHVIGWLLLGACINVAVAWWLGWRVLFQPGSLRHTEVPMEPGEFVPQEFPNELIGPAGLSLTRMRQLGADTMVVQKGPWTMRRADWPVVPLDGLWPNWGPLAGRDPREVYESMTMPIGHTARGWPMLSMWCAFEQGTHGPVQGGIHLGQRQTPETFIVTDLVLPMRPIFSGFALNALVYAAAAWLLFALPFAWRRRRRIRRGLCGACAYPFGASPVCTECGRPVGPGLLRRGLNGRLQGMEVEVPAHAERQEPSRDRD